MARTRQEAYRHLLYVALIDLRSGQWGWPWWSPRSWCGARRELHRVKAMAHCFRNLADFSVREFEGFEEEAFWRDIDSVGKTFGPASVERYRRVCDAYLAGEVFVC